MPSDMDFFDVLFARRSVRQFLPDAVPRTILEEIVQAGLEAPSGCNAHLKQYVIVDDAKTLDALRGFGRPMATAPAAIVQLIEPKATPYGDYHVQDEAASVTHMLLAAVALGYAGCWLEGPLQQHEADVRKLLGVPDNLRVAAIVPIGKAGESPPRPSKPKVADVTHYNHYGQKLPE